MRILIVQTSFLGDVILSTPVIGALAHRYPEAEISLMTTPAGAELVRRDPLVARVITFDKNGSERGLGGIVAKARELRAFGFDRAYALQRRARTALILRLAGIPTRIGFESATLSWLLNVRRPRPVDRHDVERNLAILERGELALASGELRLFAPGEGEVSPAVRECGAGAPVVLVPGSAWETKRWDPAGFTAVAKHFVAQNRRVVLLGAPSERELCAEIAAADPRISNLAGKTSLGELIWIISRGAVIICNDSMSLHVASAMKVPTVVVFCATSPTFGFGPWRTRARVVERTDLHCKPCSRHGTRSCPTGTWECSRGLPAAQVIAAAEELMAESQSEGR